MRGLGDLNAQQLESLKFEREVSKHNVAVGAVARAVSTTSHLKSCALRRNSVRQLDSTVVFRQLACSCVLPSLTGCILSTVLRQAVLP
jgi:hypothetical protein